MVIDKFMSLISISYQSFVQFSDLGISSMACLNSIEITMLQILHMAYCSNYESSLWHAHLGHVHYERMFGISKNGLIP